MTDLDKHLNLVYSGSTPLNLGDRYYSQDLIRDLQYSWDLTGQVAKRLLSTFPVLIFGGVATKGAGDTLNITEAFGLCSYDVEVPDTFAALPPSKMTVTTAKKVHASAQTNMILAAATLNGVATNYIKLKYTEIDGNTRTRAKAAGTYAYERVPSYTYVVDTTAPTDYDVNLGTLVGTAGGSFTIILSTPYNLKKAYDDLDVIEKILGNLTATITDDRTIQDSDLTNIIFADPSNKNITVTLPTLADNLKRIITVKVISIGGTVILDGEGAETIDGIANFVMQSSGDSCTVIGQTSGWRILTGKQSIDTGWINAAVTTNREMGNSYLTYDTLTGTFTPGERIVEYTDAGRTTPSGVAGRVISDSGSVCIMKDMEGIGVWTNNLYLKGLTSNAVALVNVSTKDVDTPIVHNFGVAATKLNKYFYIDDATTGVDSTYITELAMGGGIQASAANAWGITSQGVDLNSFKIQTGNLGISGIDASGAWINTDVLDYAYKTIVSRKIG